MRKLLASSFVLLFSVLPAAHAVEIEVNFKDSDNYRDIRPGNETRKMFKERVFKQITKQFTESAAEVAIGHKMVVDITDIDLAGDIDHFYTANHRAMRVVKPIYYPRISFSYRLEDKNGMVIKESEESLKDMGFLDRSSALRYERGGFKYEKRLIDEWFKVSFKMD